jgi:hypothetical protein
MENLVTMRVSLRLEGSNPGILRLSKGCFRDRLKRQFDKECGTFAERALHQDSPVVLRDNPVRDGQSQASAT